MFGNILSCKYLGKTSWVEAIVFGVISFFFAVVSANVDGLLWVNCLICLLLSFIFLKFVYSMKNITAFNVVFAGFFIDLVLAGLLVLLGISILL